MNNFFEEGAVSNGCMHDEADVIWRHTFAHFHAIGHLKTEFLLTVLMGVSLVLGLFPKFESQHSGFIKAVFLWYCSSCVEEKGIQHLMCFFIMKTLN